MALILNQSQAEAVYSAMCALNNVGMRLDTFSEAESLHVREITNGQIVVHKTPENPNIAQCEIHADQADFAIAYGLQTG